MNKKVTTSILVIVSALVGFTTLVLSSGEVFATTAGIAPRGVEITVAEVSESKVDTEVTINIGGHLSAKGHECEFEPPILRAQWVFDEVAQSATAEITKGAGLKGQTISLNYPITGQTGECTDAVKSNGKWATFSGKKKFDVSGLANGQYTVSMKVTDNLGSNSITDVSFIVEHPAPPPPPPPPPKCTFATFGEAPPHTASVGEDLWFRSVAENISSACSGKWIHEWDWNNDGTFDFTSPAQDSSVRGQNRKYTTAGIYKAVNQIKNVDSGVTVRGTPFTINITALDDDGGALPPNPPACSDVLSVGVKDIVVDFGSFPASGLLIADGKAGAVAQEVMGPVSTNKSVPAGNYRVRLASYDNHTGRPEGGQGQQFEQWRLRFKNSSNAILKQSGVIADVPEKKDTSVGVANESLAVPAGVSKFDAIHSRFDVVGSGSESVRPVCAVLTPVEESLRATLTLRKIVINDDGGTALPNDFNLKIDTVPVTTPTPAQHDVAVVLDPGNYAVSETNLPGYLAGSWGGDCAPLASDPTIGQVTLAPGDNKVCTITNDDTRDPKIEKKVSPGKGVVGTKFKYTLSYSNPGTVDAPNAKIIDDASPNNILGSHEITKQADHGGSTPCSVIGALGQEKISCNLGLLPAGQGGTVEYTVTGTVQGIVNNTACIENNNPPGQTYDCDNAVVVIEPPTGGPVCPFIETGDNIVVDFTSFTSGLRADQDEARATQGPVNKVVSEGTYKVTLASFDSHVGPGGHGGQNQEHEQWFLRFENNGGDNLAVSSASADIPENTNTIPLVPVDNALAVPAGVTKLTARHAAFPSSNPESLMAVCALLEPLPVERFADIAITKSVDPTTGTIEDTFTYTLEYFHTANSQLDAVLTTIIDIPDNSGAVKNFKITKQPDHGSCTELVEGVDGTDGITCDLGTVPLTVTQSSPGTIVYEAVAATNEATVINTAIIATDTEETVDEDDTPTNNIDTATIVISSSECVQAQITNTELEASGEVGKSFNYKIKTTGTPPITITIVDPLPAGLVFDGVDKISGTPTKKGTSEIHLESLNECGGNMVVLKIVITGGGGGCTGSCGSSKRPKIVLFGNPDNDPLVAGAFISLNQVPYTGAGDVVQVIFFLLGLVLVSGVATFGIFKIRSRRRGRTEEQSVKSGSILSDSASQGSVTTPRLSAEASEVVSQHVPSVVSGPENTIQDTSIDSVPAMKGDTFGAKDSDAVFLEQEARKDRVLISEDATRSVIVSAQGNREEARKTLVNIIETAKARYPREDGWILLNESRVSDILFSSRLSTVPLFIQWIVEGNEEHIFMFLRTMARQGRAVEEFVRKVIYELDTVYQARLDGSVPDVEKSIADNVSSLSLDDIEGIVASLTRAIDGGYKSPLTGVKVALARVLEERKMRQGKDISSHRANQTSPMNQTATLKKS